MSATYGKHTYGKLNIRAWTDTSAIVSVGSYCSIADNVSVILDGNHIMNSFSTFPFQEILGWNYRKCNYGKAVPSIGHDVWIASGVTILSGVTIGNGAVIAANTVVTKDVPPYALVAGNPGRIKKYRFSQDIIDKLLAYPWWNLPEYLIREEILPLHNSITDLVAKLEELYTSGQNS